MYLGYSGAFYGSRPSQSAELCEHISKAMREFPPGSFYELVNYQKKCPDGSWGTAGNPCQKPGYTMTTIQAAATTSGSYSSGQTNCRTFAVYIPKPQAPAAPVAPVGDITVSPTFQQSFNPQFSPTMQQVQDSPGASQGASNVQASGGGQETTGGGGSNAAVSALEAELAAQRAEAQRREERRNAEITALAEQQRREREEMMRILEAQRASQSTPPVQSVSQPQPIVTAPVNASQSYRERWGAQGSEPDPEQQYLPHEPVSQNQGYKIPLLIAAGIGGVLILASAKRTK